MSGCERFETIPSCRRVPPFHAAECRGLRKKGIDGHFYVATQMPNQSWRWIKTRKKADVRKSTNTSRQGTDKSPINDGNLYNTAQIDLVMNQEAAIDLVVKLLADALHYDNTKGEISETKVDRASSFFFRHLLPFCLTMKEAMRISSGEEHSIVLQPDTGDTFLPLPARHLLYRLSRPSDPKYVHCSPNVCELEWWSLYSDSAEGPDLYPCTPHPEYPDLAAVAGSGLLLTIQPEMMLHLAPKVVQPKKSRTNPNPKKPPQK